MRHRAVGVLVSALGVVFVTASVNSRTNEQSDSNHARPVIPKTWDDAAIASVEVPLADASASPVPVSSDYYYRMPVRPVYRSYPVYAPDREPPGYFESLQRSDPEIVFDPATLQTDIDWVRAGELVFDAPIAYDRDPLAIIRISDVRDPSWYQETGIPLTKDGVLPFLRYVVRKKGVVEVGSFSCGMCHTRLVADGTLIKGAQGNFPVSQVFARFMRTFPLPDADNVKLQRSFARSLYAAPWLRPDPQARSDRMSVREIAAVNDAIPPGVMARHGTSLFSPAQVPDLIGIRDRRYLDHTGLFLHRGIGDLMRYGAVNQDADFLSQYAGFRPIDVVTGGLPDPGMLSRYSDEQLYALARYLHAVEPPANPNTRSARTIRGEAIFQREGCAACHTPPLYTNNKLTMAVGFQPPPEDLKRFDVMPLSVGTDPGLALATRRGTGYYKVPSLKGVWYRGPFEHNGSVATLEDWFDPRRLRDDYVPTGFRGYGVKARSVKGHVFGLKLSAEDKAALIAFLKTL